MLYTKFFITEGVLCHDLGQDYFPVNFSGTKESFIKEIQNELSINRQEFTEIFDSFTSNEISKKYKDFMSNTKITIYTLTVDKTDTIPLIFNSAMTRVPAAINDLANNDSPMVMNNRDTYELMYNLINEYYINWEKAIEFLLNDAINSSHVTAEFPFRLLGKPVHLSDNMDEIGGNKLAILYGDYSGLSVNFREDIGIEVLREAYHAQHAIGIDAWFEFDSKVTDEQKLAVLKVKAS